MLKEKNIATISGFKFCYYDYINGKLEGESKIYDMNGQLFEICNYVNGNEVK
jgi:antitoxin component YwqK of YwqJK toxin-antitoxin module